MALHPTDVAVSAPGKAFLAGGYIVLDRAYRAMVLGLSARINVAAVVIHTGPGVHLGEVVVESPQFRGAVWRYGYHMADAQGGIAVTQLQVAADRDVVPNPFVETTLAYALSYVAARAGLARKDTIPPARLVILADNDYYSLPESAPKAAAAAAMTTTTTTTTTPPSRFARFPTSIAKTNKTGLGSSAALVTSLTAAVLAHYLPRTAFDLAGDEEIADRSRHVLHNLAQAAHCAAQGKVGSGFDVAAAVYGSCIYTRFSPNVLAMLPAVGQPGFGLLLARLVEARPVEGGNTAGQDGDDDIVSPWDYTILPRGIELPPGVALRMCDVDCGSQTVGMVKKVLAWRAAQPEACTALWSELQARNDDLAAVLRERRLADLPAAISRTRELVRAMGVASDVPIEPPSQTRLLDALAADVEGVYGGVVPGAGGFDALALLVRDDDETERRIKDYLAGWRWAEDERGLGEVRLLDVKGEMEGVRLEGMDLFQGRI
jgi:phosphomevalonate kinase